MILQDIYLPVRDKQIFEETLLNTILEGVSKEQKEIAQRAMAKEDMKIAVQLKKYLDNKWKNNKKDLKQAKLEYGRLFLITKKIAEFGSKSDPEMKEYLNKVMGMAPQWLTYKSNDDTSKFVVDKSNSKPPRVMLATGKINDIAPRDFDFDNLEDSKIEKLVRQGTALHEYGHLYDWLKEYIETGKVENFQGTMDLVRDGKYEELEKREGVANAYFIDNTYRKDRRELLKNSKGFKDLDKSIKAVNDERKKVEGTKLTLTDLYRYGTNEESKTLNPTLKSIRLEEANKSKELKTIQSFAKQIEDRFKNIGYKVPSIVCAVRDNYTKQKRNMYPIFTDTNNGRKIFIDIDAYEDLSKNKEAMMFYLPHEIAHIISREDHGGKMFNEVVNNWNKNYKEKILADPEDEDEFNKKYLPTYFKKVSWLDSVKPDKKNNISADEIADKGMKNKVWKENYFNY